MRLFIMLLLITFFSCKKGTQQRIDKDEKVASGTEVDEKQLEVIKCFKSSYQGDFNGSTIQLSIDKIHKIDDYNYKLIGSTTHKENTVAYEGMLQLDNTVTNETTTMMKLSYNLEEKEAEHGSGKFSGDLLLEVPVINNNFIYDSALVKFIGNYFFPDGNTLPCTFGLEN